MCGWVSVDIVMLDSSASIYYFISCLENYKKWETRDGWMMPGSKFDWANKWMSGSKLV